MKNQVRDDTKVRIAREKSREYIQPAIVRRPEDGLALQTAVALQAAGGLVNKFQIPVRDETEARQLAQDLQEWMQKAIEESIERWEMSRQDQKSEVQSVVVASEMFGG